MSLFAELKEASENLDDDRTSCEWLGKTVFAGPLTPKQLDIVQKHSRTNVGGTIVVDQGAQLVWMCKVCIEDADGRKVFNDPGNRNGALKWLESRTIDELAGVLKSLAISDDDFDSMVEDAKKDSPPTD